MNRTWIAALGFATLIVSAVGIYRSLRFQAPPTGEILVPAARAAKENPAAGPVFTYLKAPRRLPEIRFSDEKGRTLTLKDFRGKVVLLNIWATWCPPCRKEMPTLDRLQAKLGGPDFQVVALSIDQGGIFAVKSFFDELGVSALSIYNDKSSEVTAFLNVIGIPTTVLIDRQGREIGRKVGEAEWDNPAVIAEIKKQL